MKLQFLCHAGPTEVGAFGISSARDLLYVEDVVTVRQACTAVTTHFLDEAVADHLDLWADRGVPPERSGRVWIHTHPGSSALPSGTDEETYARAFGGCDWAVMAILSRAGRSYARLQVNAGPGARGRLRWAVDWPALPQELINTGPVHERWAEEYLRNVERPIPRAKAAVLSEPFWPGEHVGAEAGHSSSAPCFSDAIPEELDEWYAGACGELEGRLDYFGGEYDRMLP